MQINLGDNETVPQTSLKRCVNASLSGGAAGCITPGSLSKLGPRETPKSGRGSSIFSPGETFWKEAIQVADGLLPKDNLHSQAALESQNLKPDKEIRTSNDLQNGGCCNKSNNLLAGDAARESNGGTLSADGPILKHGKDLVKEVSPLPVKHFDFSSEDKNLGEETSSYGNIMAHHNIEGKKIVCASLNHETTQTHHGLSLQIEANTDRDLLEVREMRSKYAAADNKMNIWIQDSDSVTSDAKDRKLNEFTPTGDFNQDNTPSSFLPLEDRLDLNNWLPSELCSIYKKRGMSKLYPWQVFFSLWMSPICISLLFLPVML